MSRVEKTSAIVLRRHEFSETSLTVTLFTREAGKLRCIAKGARRPRSPLEGALEPFTMADAVIYLKNPPAMHILSQAVTVENWRGLRTDLVRFYRAHYFAEILLWILPFDLPDHEAFDRARWAFTMLHEGGNPEAVSFSFEAGMLRHAGHMPRTQSCTGCDREWKQAEEVLFQAQSGGGLCKACSIERGARGTAVSSVALTMLGRIGEDGIPRVDRVKLPAKTTAEMRLVLDETFLHLFEAVPRSRRFL